MIARSQERLMMVEFRIGRPCPRSLWPSPFGPCEESFPVLLLCYSFFLPRACITVSVAPPIELFADTGCMTNNDQTWTHNQTKPDDRTNFNERTNVHDSSQIFIFLSPSLPVQTSTVDDQPVRARHGHPHPDSLQLACAALAEARPIAQTMQDSRRESIGQECRDCRAPSSAWSPASEGRHRLFDALGQSYGPGVFCCCRRVHKDRKRYLSSQPQSSLWRASALGTMGDRDGYDRRIG
jgi:hypothetical protein